MLSTPKAKAELFLASSLYDGLEDNNIMQVTTLLLNKEADPNVLIPSQGITPFHLVIGNDSETFAEEVTKLFLRHGGNPNIKSVDGMTPVHVAAAWGRLGVLELLLSNGGDPLAVDDDGRCPFHYAFDEAHYDAVTTLGKYCGESFEEDLVPKYNIALDKILVSNGGVVAEYAVSEDTFAAIAGDVPAICTSKNSINNNHLLKNINQQFGDMVKIENRDTDWHPRYPANTDFTITMTADESVNLLLKFVNGGRHWRCLPQKNLERVECNLRNENEPGRVERDLCKENLPIEENRQSISYLNDPIIEASFHIEPRKVGENMPRVSSPKSNKELIKSERDTGIECRNTKSSTTTPWGNNKVNDKKKFVHKTPLRCCSRRGPLIEMKKTPTVASTKKMYDLHGRITPNNGKFSLNDRVAVHTPNYKYISKQSSYSPDCSIISKSPNLIIPPITPTNNCKLWKERKRIPIGNAGTMSVKNLKKPSVYGSSCKTPTPDKICNNGSSGNNFSRFAKQSELRHQHLMKTPVSSPSKYRDSVTRSMKSPRTPNLTDSEKRKNKISTSKTKNALTPSKPKTRLPSTPLNKTYRKNKYFNAASLSPDVENSNRFTDRRTFTRNIAIKLEETMYDDDCDKNIMSTDIEKMQKIPKTETLVQGSTENAINSESCIAMERQISHFADNRSNHLNKRINLDQLASNQPVQISGVNTITEITEGEITDGCLSQLYNDARGSNIIAGFLHPADINGSSVTTNDTDGIMNDTIIFGISRTHSSILAGYLLRSKTSDKKERSDDATALAACFKRPNSKDIDDSLVSSDPSSYSLDNWTRDPIDSLNFCDTDTLMRIRELMKNKRPLSNGESKSEFPVLDTAGYTCPADTGKASSIFLNISSSVDNSSYASFLSVEEEYKYEDAEKGVILLERRLITTQVSIPIIKPEDRVLSSPGRSSQCLDDESMQSCISSLPHSLVIIDNETLRRELMKFDCRPPGPITATTRHIYLKRLRRLQKHGPASPAPTIAIPPKFSTEIERTLRSDTWMIDLSPYETLEQQVFSDFSNPNPTRRWREGTTKSSFNYLLMDPRVTDNLPCRANSLSPIARWQIFLSSIFYVGKGRRSRPYAHLYEAYSEWKQGNRSTSDKKVNCILDIWGDNCGVVCLHFFQNTIPVEAYTREAAMIEALGLERLKNVKSGDYYGVAATWSHHQKRTLGVYLLYKAMHILINEGERQLSPDDIGR